MNSKLTINDLKETITDKINEYIRALFEEVDEFENIINLNDLEVWYDDIECTIKLLKKLKLLENKIDSKNIFTDDEIDHYYMLACKPERINIKNIRRKYFNPVTEQFVYHNC